MKILWICFVWPEPDSSAAGTRTIELLNILKNAGHEIRVCSPCQPNSYKEALSNLGFITEYQAANDSRFDTFIEQYQPDIVFFDRFVIEEQFSWRVRQYCPDALRVLDTIDLHSLRRARQRKVQEGLDARELSIPDLQSEDAIREIAAIYRSDLSLIVSDFEIEFLQRNYNLSDSLLALCRFSSSKLEIVPSFEERCHFVSIGNFNHAPNIDSIKVLQENIWAEIKVRL